MNYLKLQEKATKLITKYGMKAILRRAGEDRECIVVMMDQQPMEHSGQLLDQVPMSFMISATNLIPGPDMAKDVLVTLDPTTGDEVMKLKIVRPPEQFAPAGVILYWEVLAKR